MIAIFKDDSQFFLIPALGLTIGEGLWVTVAFMNWGLSVCICKGRGPREPKETDKSE